MLMHVTAHRDCVNTETGAALKLDCREKIPGNQTSISIALALWFNTRPTEIHHPTGRINENVDRINESVDRIIKSRMQIGKCLKIYLF